jgi:hypothetical protein
MRVLIVCFFYKIIQKAGTRLRPAKKRPRKRTFFGVPTDCGLLGLMRSPQQNRWGVITFTFNISAFFAEIRKLNRETL